MNSRHIAIALGLVWGAIVTAQHSPLTSQYLFNGLLINPAYAGSRDALAAEILHRQQWVGFAGAPATSIMSVHAPFAQRRMGAGIIVINDRVGVSNETGVMLSHAYRLKFPHGKLAFGIGAGFTMLRANWHEVALQDMNDLPFLEPSRTGPQANFSAGLYYHSDRSFLGLSAPFLMSHRHGFRDDGFRMSEARADIQPMLTAGHLFALEKDIELKPSVLVRYHAQSGVQCDINTNIYFKERFGFGLSYRTSDAVVGMLEIRPGAQWRIGYAYDMGVSAIRRHHHGSHELAVQYELGYRIRVRDPRYF